ncbi:hypothetical protein DFA_04833 [Cavenderia fasciculata]|uniref:Uncharacterized protein n=1 Tax=Cavenderia fasciculata TaxID=261658 RepID=F4PM00_CACFS|nr:uncharacterized protein DFA_04833 [Cavenderia fasciculata]EGG22703.1 hypothetical protein DFA_04833 [Cavenderia fasciculata]|eukprot:XP_004360554.1 hypothetical protein DFA_04833 [Cavenderia fasciculata]
MIISKKVVSSSNLLKRFIVSSTNNYGTNNNQIYTTNNNRNIICKYNSNIHSVSSRYYSTNNNKKEEQEEEEEDGVDDDGIDVKQRERIRRAMLEKVAASHKKSTETLQAHNLNNNDKTNTTTTTAKGNTTTTKQDEIDQDENNTDQKDKEQGQAEGEKKEEKVYDRDNFAHFSQTKFIYTIFGASLLTMIGFAIRGALSDGSSFQMPYDNNLILRDIFDDYHNLYEDCEEFKKIIPPQSTAIVDKFIQVEVQKDTLSFTIPILQKATMSLVATYNIDFYKEGDVFKCSNLYLDVVNGKHFVIDHPNHEYNTTSPKYTLSMLMNQHENLERQKKLMEEKEAAH